MKYLWAALLGLVLSACSSDSVYSGPFNRAAPLPAYPGATDVSYTEDGDDTRVTFFVTASLEDVYGFFHGELTGSGWQRTDLEAEPSETEADYAQGARVLEFELEVALDGVFELEVDLGGDNAAYDEDNGGDDNSDDSDDDNGDGSGDDGSGDDGGDGNPGGDDSGDGSDDDSDDSGDDNPDGGDDGSGDDSSGDDGGGDDNGDDSGGSSGDDGGGSGDDGGDNSGPGGGGGSDDGGGSDEDDGDDSDDSDGSGDMIGTTTRALS